MDLDRIIARLSDPKVLAAIAVAVVVLIILRRLFGRANVTSHTVTSRCSNCGWSGSVSKFKPVCPRCAKPVSV